MPLSDSQHRLLTLAECPGIGPATLWTVLRRYNGPPDEGFFSASAGWFADTFGVSVAVAKALESLKETSKHTGEPREAPFQAFCAFDTGYPPRLRRLKDPPPVVFATSGPSVILTIGNLCVLSSNSALGGSASAVKDAVERGIASGYGVVAGHNKPPYQLALLAAKRNNATSVMVLDRGLYCAFDDDLRRDPVPAARIWGYAFDAERSVALSPFRPRDKWIGRNSQYRDALVAALSDVIVAVGVREGGVMNGVCRDALARGQTVFAAADCYPFLAEHGALPWQGELPAPSQAAP